MIVTLRPAKGVNSMQSFNLPHAVYCAGGKCECTPTEVLVHGYNKEGVRGMKPNTVLAPRSVLLFPGQVVTGLHDSVLRCPEVVAALAAKQILAATK